MKNLDLNNYGVQEMNAGEMGNVDGGSEARASTYMTSDQMNAVGAGIRTGIGFVVGILATICRN